MKPKSQKTEIAKASIFEKLEVDSSDSNQQSESSESDEYEAPALIKPKHAPINYNLSSDQSNKAPAL